MSSVALFNTASSDGLYEYRQFYDLKSKSDTYTLSQLEKAMVYDVSLFSLPESFDFKALDSTLDEVIRALPYIKNVLSRPITHIKNESELLPVEAVRSISNETVSHISVHSELWQNIENGNLHPRKLLSQNHIDNYCIYENVIIARFVNFLLSYCSRNMQILSNILYSNRNLQFNLLERENHPSFFLALGKLHTGYVRDYGKYNAVCEAGLEKLKFITRSLKLCLKKPMYKSCKKASGKLSLRKTNIFRNDKEYGRIYRLIKYFASKNTAPTGNVLPTELYENTGYFEFCTLITLFGVMHFNFSFDESTVFNLDRLNVACDWKGFRLNIQQIKSRGLDAIKLSVKKDCEYTIVLIPETADSDNKELLLSAKHTFKADEYRLLSPVREDGDTLLLSSYDVEAFRKIQQLLLKAMVYSDNTQDTCPFCGDVPSFDGGTCLCRSCRTEITLKTCPETNLTYKAVKINNLRITADKFHNNSSLYFRNITEITESGDIICPHCGHIHTR